VRTTDFRTNTSGAATGNDRFHPNKQDQSPTNALGYVRKRVQTIDQALVCGGESEIRVPLRGAAIHRLTRERMARQAGANRAAAKQQEN
jgi:hypothetical protein